MLGDLTLTRCPDGTTTLTGPIADQAQLHGVLTQVRDLGVPLLALRTLEAESPPADAQAAGPALAHPLRTERLTLRPRPTPTPPGPTDASRPWVSG